MVNKLNMAVQGTDVAQCPRCGSTGVHSKELLMASMLGSELPLDFEIYRCPRKHYWRVWDNGTKETIAPELEKGPE